MEDTNIAVEEVTETAAAPQGVDYEALLAEKDAEIAKVQSEKENYRKGLLKAKGKLHDDFQPDAEGNEDQEAMMRRIVNETLLSTKEAQLASEKEATLKAMIKRNKELEIALKNRGQVTSNSGEGSNQDKPEGKRDSYFSNDQLSALKAKGYDDKKIAELKKNLTKVNEMPK